MLTKEAKQFLLENTPKIPGLSPKVLQPMPDMSRRLKPMGEGVIHGAEDALYKFISEEAIPAGKVGWSILLDGPNQQLLQTNLLLGKKIEDATDVYYKNRKETSKRVVNMYDGPGGVRERMMVPRKKKLLEKPMTDSRKSAANFFYYQFPLLFSTGLGRIPMPKVIQKPVTKILNKIPPKVVKGTKIAGWLPYQMGENYFEERLHDMRREAFQNMAKMVDADARSQ
jgi:hypothetical protein